MHKCHCMALLLAATVEGSNGQPASIGRDAAAGPRHKAVAHQDHILRAKLLNGVKQLGSNVLCCLLLPLGVDSGEEEGALGVDCQDVQQWPVGGVAPAVTADGAASVERAVVPGLHLSLRARHSVIQHAAAQRVVRWQLVARDLGGQVDEALQVLALHQAHGQPLQKDEVCQSLIGLSGITTGHGCLDLRSSKRVPSVIVTDCRLDIACLLTEPRAAGVLLLEVPAVLLLARRSRSSSSCSSRLRFLAAFAASLDSL
jgi:hypothetical protein